MRFAWRTRRRATRREVLVTAAIVVVVVFAAGWVVEGTIYSLVGVAALVLWAVAIEFLTRRPLVTEREDDGLSG